MRLEPKQYRDIYKRLPPEIFDLVNSGETTSSLYNIAEKHKLHIDEAGVLHDIVMDTAMGVIATKNMQSEIIRELKLNSLDAAAIVRDVEAEVLAPIKESMTNLYKHTNPFMPQTLKYIDEDEESNINIDRNNLLHEIENPTESRAVKVVPPPVALSDENEPVSVSTIPDQSQEKPEDMAAKIAEDMLRASRDRMLSAITDQELPGVVAMKHFMDNPETPPPQIKAIPEQEAASVEAPVIKAPEIASPAAIPPVSFTPVPPVASKTEAVQPQKPADVAIPESINPPKPSIDPYRESIV